jgi:hypothetical protein
MTERGNTTWKVLYPSGAKQGDYIRLVTLTESHDARVEYIDGYAITARKTAGVPWMERCFAIIENLLVYPLGNLWRKMQARGRKQ